VIGYEQAVRYAHIIERLTGESEISPPGLALEVDRPEWKALGNTRLWAGHVAVGAVALNFGQIAIGPPDNRILSVIEGFLVLAGASGVNVGVVGGLGGFSAGLVLGNRDGRMTGSPATRGFTKNSSAVSLFTANNALLVQTNLASTPTMIPFVIRGSQFQLVFETQVVNVTLDVMVWGYERRCRPEEELNE
jgi:hypothetical protein